MKIDRTESTPVYYDIHGKRISAGMLVYMDGRAQRVYETASNELGTDATNPTWLASGFACECEWGIYPFDEVDEPEIIDE